MNEKTPLGIAGSVRAAVLGFCEPFLIVGGNIVCNFEFEKIIKYHKSHGADITVVCTDNCKSKSLDFIDIDESGKVKSFTDETGVFKSEFLMADTGIYVMNPDVVSLIPEDGKIDFNAQFFNGFIKKGIEIAAYKENGYFCKIIMSAIIREYAKTFLTAIKLYRFPKSHRAFLWLTVCRKAVTISYHPVI